MELDKLRHAGRISYCSGQEDWNDGCWWTAQGNVASQIFFHIGLEERSYCGVQTNDCRSKINTSARVIHFHTFTPLSRPLLTYVGVCLVPGAEHNRYSPFPSDSIPIRALSTHVAQRADMQDLHPSVRQLACCLKRGVVRRVVILRLEE